MPQPYAQGGGAAGLAGGVPAGAPAGVQPAGQPPTTVAAQGNTTTTQVTQILETLKQILPQVVDEKGYVNMDRLITLWPQFSQVPFQVVMQILQQSPELLAQLVTQFGLSGIMLQGRMIGADQLVAAGQGGGV